MSSNRALVGLLSHSTASNSNKSSPTCSPVLRKRSRSPTPQTQEGENMVEKGSDHSSDKSPSTPEQVVQRTYSLQSARSGGKNSKKSQSWYNHERQHIMRVSMTCILVQPRYLSLSLVFQLREIVITLFPVSHFTKFAQCCYRQLQATVWRKLLGYVGV
ncbi:hypothetical protein GOODEAATRI_016859 [Goodea atripinnis]|uniref:Uncharacterized protein n=1 Tax=Goodea atripinnis TaxID=208336 RepID=A0ABV0NKY0_9TELE